MEGESAEAGGRAGGQSPGEPVRSVRFSFQPQEEESSLVNLWTWG